MDERDYKRLQAVWRRRNKRKNNWVGLRLSDNDEEALTQLTTMLDSRRAAVVREAVRWYAATLVKERQSVTVLKKGLR